jgi:phosphoglycerate dehydrogenase-like enzyme/phenylpropionate dioxygenase-like ring-hydroxylating dioxygenase large terminal subunit
MRIAGRDREAFMPVRLESADLAIEPIEQAHTIPASWYLDPEVLALERATIFSRTWQWVGRVDQVATPGSYFTCDVVGEPIVVVRGGDNVLRAFSNVCRHRAGPVARGSGAVDRFRCAYHGWVYGLDGALLGTPYVREVPGFVKEENCLPRIPVTTWGPLVLVNLDPQARPLSESLGDLAERLARYRLADLAFYREVVFEVGCNWKVYAENSRECVHCPSVHPSFRYAYEVENARLETFDRCSTMFVSERGAPLAGEAELATVVPAARNLFGSRRRIRHGLSEVEQTSIGFAYIFPNLIWTLAPDHVSVSRSIPTAPDRMVFVRNFFLEAGEAPDTDSWNESNFKFRIQTTQEDVAICEAVQKGLSISSRSSTRSTTGCSTESSPARMTASRRRPRPSSSPSRRLREVQVHIENSRAVAPVFAVTPAQYADALGRHGWAMRVVKATIGYDFEEFEAAMQTAEILLATRFPRDDLGRRAPRLRWIHTRGAGIDHLLPLDWLPPGVILTNNRGVHAPQAGEFACMALLALNNRLPVHVTDQRSARWSQTFCTPIAGKTVAILGVGEIGGAAARRARQLKMRVLGVRRSRRPHRYVDEMFGPEDLPDVLSRADFVVVTLPLTSRTRGLIGRKELDGMKPGAGFVNMGRAGIVDYEALAGKLARGELGGAILDVFDPEPLPPESPLWATPNLIITPHVSSDDAEQYISLTLDLFFDNLRRYLTDRPLRNRVDATVEY